MIRRRRKKFHRTIEDSLLSLRNVEDLSGFLRAITSQRAALGRARSAVSYPHQVGARERAKNINASSAGTSNLGFGKVLRSQNAMAYHPLSFDA